MKKLLAVALLALSSFAFGATLTPIQLLNPVGSTAGQAIVSTGASTAPAWASVTASSLAAQAANTVLANVTASSHSPTAVALPSCSSATSALQYTSGSGFVCGSSFASLTAANTFNNSQTVNGLLRQTDASNNTSQLGITGTGSNGANVTLTGNGATTPSKTLRANSGNLNVVNDGYSAIILTLTDAGVLSTTGGISNTPISGSTGAFTTLSSSGVASLGTGSTVATSPARGDSTNKAATTFFVQDTLNNPPSIGSATPAAGKFTTLQATSTITPSSTAGIVGTATNDNANAGSVGEYVQNTGSNVAIASATPVNVTSISLTAGDWDVTGLIQTAPAGTTTTASAAVGISGTSATFATIATGLLNFAALNNTGFTAGGQVNMAAPITRITLSSTTTIFLVSQIIYGTSTLTISGQIRARRVR
jgi:hypothetical protein